MTTIRELITDSLRSINAVAANEEPTAGDATVSLRMLLSLVDNLSTDQLNIFTTQPFRYLLTAGKSSYTMGPEFDASGNPLNPDFLQTRPVRIERANILLQPSVGPDGVNIASNTVTYPMRKLDDNDYATIGMRGIGGTFPSVFYDDGNFPLRTIYFWPVPNQSYGVEFWCWEPLTRYTSLNNQLELPPGYELFLRLKLAVALAPEFGKSLQPELLALLQEAEDNVKRLNVQTPIAHLSTAARGASKRSSMYPAADYVGFRGGLWML